MNSRTLTTEVIASSASGQARTTLQASVYVKDGEDTVEGADVQLSSDAGGHFSRDSGLTDVNGAFHFEFTAPDTATSLNVTITTLATKSGHIEGSGQAQLLITPSSTQGPSASAGYSTIIILAIVLAVAVMAIILVLVKFGTITVTYGNRENST